jgi:hypothetical protein
MDGYIFPLTDISCLKFEAKQVGGKGKSKLEEGLKPDTATTSPQVLLVLHRLPAACIKRLFVTPLPPPGGRD